MTILQGSICRFYLHETDRHGGRMLWEWLLGEANRLGIRGGSAFRAIGGFGRHHVVHENHFFELAGSATIEVEFIVTEEEARQLLALLEKEKVHAFYALTPAQFGTS